MAVTQYIGSRYVPVFADPIEWSSQNTYEALTIVLYQGNSFTSKQAVPKGIDITNEDFWAETGNYDAQVEQYRREVLSYTEDVEDVSDRITEVDGLIPSTEFDDVNTVKKYIDDRTNAAFDYATIPDHVVDNSIIQFTFEIPQGHDTQGGCPFSAVDNYTFDANGLYFATITGKTDNTLRKLWIHNYQGTEISTLDLPLGHWGNCFYKNGFVYSYNSYQSGVGDEQLYKFDVTVPRTPSYDTVSGLSGSYAGACNYKDNKVLLYRAVDSYTFSFYSFDLDTKETEYLFDLPNEKAPLFGNMSTFTYNPEDNTLLRNGTRPNTVIVYSVETQEKRGVYHINDFNGYSDVGELESFLLLGKLCYYHSLYAEQNILPLSSSNTVGENMIPPRVVQWFYTDMRGLSTNRETWTDGHIIKHDYYAVTHGRNYFATGPVRVFVKYAFQALACVRYMRSNLQIDISSRYPYAIVFYDLNNIEITASSNTIRMMCITKSDNVTFDMNQTAFIQNQDTDEGYVFNSRVYKLYCSFCGSMVINKQWRDSRMIDDLNRFAMFYRVCMINALAVGRCYFRQSIVKTQEMKNCYGTNSSLGFAPASTFAGDPFEAASASYVILLPTAN